MTEDLSKDSQVWLEHLDDDALLWLDGLHNALGNYGTTHEHIQGILDGVGNALYDLRAKLDHKDQKKAARAARDLATLLKTVEHLAKLAKLTPPSTLTTPAQ